MDEDSICKKAFIDISRGFSFFDSVYVKHFTEEDESVFDQLYEDELSAAKARGLPTEEEKLKYCIETECSWKLSDENHIEKQRKFLEILVANKRSLILDKDIERQNSEIKAVTEDIIAKTQERAQILGKTCEYFATKRMGEYKFYSSLFKDRDLKVPFFTKEDFEYFEDRNLGRFVKIYSNFQNLINEENLKKVAIRDFFQTSWNLGENNAFYYFGRPICNLTIYQTRLATYGKIFRDIFANIKDIPEEIVKDPDKVIDYAVSVRNAEKHKAKMGDGNVSIPRASKNDYKKFGLDEDDTLDLREEMKKRGKESFSGRDMARMQGL